MKLYFVVTLFAVVFVSVNSGKDEFKKEVMINNSFIVQTQRAGQLHTVVKHIISGSKPMADVSLLLAVPDFAVTSENICDLPTCIFREQVFGTELIRLMSGFIQPHPHLRRQVKGLVTPIFEERAIGNANIVTLGDERRSFIIEAIIKITGEDGLNVQSLETCRLVGLFRSIIHFIHDSYIVKAEVENGVCKLTSKMDIVSRYIQLADGIYEVVSGGGSTRLEKFN